MSKRVLVTGANGHLGARLIAGLQRENSGFEVVAAVRSERAADQVRSAPGGAAADVQLVDYTST